jgi:hypothetical protein
LERQRRSPHPPSSPSSTSSSTPLIFCQLFFFFFFFFKKKKKKKKKKKGWETWEGHETEDAAFVSEHEIMASLSVKVLEEGVEGTVEKGLWSSAPQMG